MGEKKTVKREIKIQVTGRKFSQGSVLKNGKYCAALLPFILVSGLGVFLVTSSY